jgi:twitching motility protein PilT
MKLETLLKMLATSKFDQMQVDPDAPPTFITPSGKKNASDMALTASTIAAMVFPSMSLDDKLRLPNLPRVAFNITNEIGSFNCTVVKAANGLSVTFDKITVNEPGATAESGKLNAPLPYQVENTPPMPVNKFAPTAENKVKPPVLNKPAETPPPAADSKQNSASTSKSLLGSLQSVFSSVSKQTVEEADDVVEVLETEDEAPTPSYRKETFQPQPYVETSYKQSYSADNNGAKFKPKMDALFHKMAEMKASDLHLSVSMPPMVRKDGRMQPLNGSDEPLTPETMRDLLRSIMPEKNREEFERRHDTDFAYEIPNLARFRANIFMDRKGMGGVFRIIPTKILTAQQLGLSQAILDLCNLSKGLVVVTGPTGSGKSTTLSAMIDHVNKTREEHIITIEDPIEFVHENQKCLVNQREVHNHTDSFKDALRAALREDPDILLVGEMRDLETIAIAIETAETGHLVFGTLHTTTAPSTVDRIIDQFPADRQQQVRVMLSESLKGVIAQTLLPKKGGGRVAAMEVLIVTPAISNLIREGKTFQIASSMQTGKNVGMVVLNDALVDLVKKDLVTPRDAYLKAVDKPGLEALLKRHGIDFNIVFN